MKTTDSKNLHPNLARACRPWLCALSALGCQAWPSLEREIVTLEPLEGRALGALAVGGDTLAQSSEAAGSEPAGSEPAAGEDEVTASYRTELGSEQMPVVAASLASAAGTLFVTGTASGEAEGGSDALLAAYDRASGAPLWTRRLGSPQADGASAAAATGDLVLIAGRTDGALGAAPAGFGDAFVAAHSSLGELLWTRQLGSAAPDAALALSVGPGALVLVAGETRGVLDGERSGTDKDAFAAGLDADGELLWTAQLGSQRGYDDVATGVASAVNGDVLLAGYTFGALDGTALGSADVFVARLDADGERLWTAQLGGADYDAAEAVAVDADGSIYVAGQTGGFLAGGPGVIVGGRPLLAKLSPAGELLWQLELGDAEMGSASVVTLDAGGDVWISGHTSASFAGPNQGAYDAFLARVSSAGELLSTLQLGEAGNDRAAGLAVDDAGPVLLSRATRAGEAPFDVAVLYGLAP